MKIANEIILLIIIVICIFFIAKSTRSKSDNGQVLEMKMDCDILYRRDTIYTSTYTLQELINHKYKVVIVLDQRVISVLKDWRYYIKKYDNIPFIIYVGSKNKEYIQGCLEKFDFPIPVFIDKEYTDDYLFISYILNEKNEVIDVTNPTMPNFGKTLKKISAEM